MLLKYQMIDHVAHFLEDQLSLHRLKGFPHIVSKLTIYRLFNK